MANLMKLSKEHGRTELLFVLYQFCSDYHSGQWSRGYRILSRISKLGIRIVAPTELQQSEIYAYLETNYADKV